MASQERNPGADLAAQKAALVERHKRIEADARRYSFFKLVYTLERVHAGTAPVGHLGPASDERIRLRGDTSIAFPSSDVSHLALATYGDGVERSRVDATFLALYGSTSPLPLHFSEELAQIDFQGAAQPVREFLDVIHHRLLSLFYRVWTKYRLGLSYRRQGKDAFTRRMFCSVGLDGFRDHPTPIHRFLYLKYAPLLASKSRSVRGLQHVLDDLFGTMGAKIDQFVGHWTLIEKPYRNKLGVMNHQLGESLTIGRYVFDGSGRYTIVLGPLGYDEYLSFLPGGHRRPVLRGICATFTRGAYDVMLELHVKTDSAPRFQLGAPRAATLKRTAWLGGSGGQPFVITVPLEDPKKPGPGAEDEDQDDGEPPPL